MVEDPCAIKGSTITVNRANINGALSGVPGARGPAGCPTIVQTTVLKPPAVGKHYLGFFNAITEIKRVHVVLQGTDASATFNIRHSTNYNSGSGVELFDADVTTTNVSIGTVYPDDVAFVVDANTTVARAHVWADITALGTVTDEMVVNLVFQAECEDVLGDVGVPLEDSATATANLPLAENT